MEIASSELCMARRTSHYPIGERDDIGQSCMSPTRSRGAFKWKCISLRMPIHTQYVLIFPYYRKLQKLLGKKNMHEHHAIIISTPNKYLSQILMPERILRKKQLPFSIVLFATQAK